MGNVSETIVIVGAGPAAGQRITTRRQQQMDRRIGQRGEQPNQPYQRPPRSNEYLAGVIPPERGDV
jgi:hypothetical protein